MLLKENKIINDKLERILNPKNIDTLFEEIEINNNIPFTFTTEDYQTKEGKPKYSDANALKKSGPAIAIISKNTICAYFSKDIDYPKPINFEKLVNKNNATDDENIGIYQKCHIIGYHLSAKFSNANNVFIGTKQLNNGPMKKIEEYICNIVENQDRKILYKVTPIYMFEKDIVPIGVLFEYESVDNKEKIQGCKFCFNNQPNHKINYYDGSNEKIENIDINKENIVNEIPKKSVVSSTRKKYKNYYLNIKTNVFHLIYDEKEKCEDLKGIAIKYIQEVTADRDEILEHKFFVCKKCEKNYNKKFIKTK